MALKFYGKAESAAKAILDAFRNPNQLPKALAPIFIRKNDDSIPCHKWSWSNQLLTALSGHTDARGFRQWQEIGRHVKKGEKSFQILVPLKRKIEREKADDFYLTYGFKSCPVFGLSQTDGKPLVDPNPELTKWIDSLPLIDVARDWGISVVTYNGENANANGKYSPLGAIALGVTNLSTWAHEMIHAADDRRQDGLKGGQQMDQEIVAEFGGAVLLSALGHGLTLTPMQWRSNGIATRRPARRWTGPAGNGWKPTSMLARLLADNARARRPASCRSTRRRRATGSVPRVRFVGWPAGCETISARVSGPRVL